VLATALGMIVLDGTIVAVALPAIIADLQLDLTDAQWVNSLYSVVFAALLLTAGRLGDRLGRRALLLVGLGAFVTGSVLAAVSVGVDGLLVARAVQGVGAAMVLPATLSTVNATFRGRDRAAAFGIWVAVMSGAAALGPLVGGLLTEYGSWTLVFWVNVPVGIAVFVAALRLVPETRSRDADPARGVDVVGPVLSALGFGLLVFGLIEGGRLGWWVPTGGVAVFGLPWPSSIPVSPAPIAIAFGAIALGAFVAWENRRRFRGRPTVLDPRLFRIRTFALGNLTALLVAAGEFALLFVLPLYLVSSLGLGPLGAGAVLAAMAGGAFASGAAARHLATTIGPSRVVVVGLLLEVAGAAATAVVIPTLGAAWAIALALLPYGLGLGLASAQLTSTVLRDVPVAQSGAGSATQSTVRQLGAALGSAVGGSVLAAALGAAQAPSAPADAFAAASATTVWAAVSILGLALTSAVRLHRSRPDPRPVPARAIEPEAARTDSGAAARAEVARR
jgi:EmrB/QacA subfamily drug resistance transporter